MDFLKKHYEKVLLGVVLVGLAVGAALLPWMISKERDLERAKADEIIIYYLRKDAAYGNWGFWIWAAPGGDGGANLGKLHESDVGQFIGGMLSDANRHNIAGQLMPLVTFQVTPIRWYAHPFLLHSCVP